MFEAARGLLAHDVELQRSVVGVPVASGDTEGFAPSEARTVSVRDGMWWSQKLGGLRNLWGCVVQNATV